MAQSQNLDESPLIAVPHKSGCLLRTVPDLRDPILEHCHYDEKKERNLWTVSLQHSR